MTGDADDTVDSIVDAAVERADPTPDTFRPVSVDDRFDKRVRDDHAPNQALHDALKAAAEDDDRIHSVNLIGSHAPGNKHKGEPRYHVRVDVRNDGMGHPVLGATVAGRMVDRGNVRITDVAECSDDHLVVCLRPRETRVEPIDVPYRDLPGDVVRDDTVEDDAARVLAKSAQGQTVAKREVEEVARALATVVYTANPDRFADEVDDPDAAPQAAYDALLERADVDPDDFPATYSVTEVGGESFEHGVIEDGEHARKVARCLLDEHAECDVFDGRALVDSLEDLADRLEREGGNRGEDRGAPYRRAASDIRVALDNHVGGRDDEPETMAEATASGLGLAMVAESVARHGDGHGAPRSDLDIDDDAIDKAIDRGVVIERDGVLYDTRDVVRKVQAVERGAVE